VQSDQRWFGLCRSFCTLTLTSHRTIPVEFMPWVSAVAAARQSGFYETALPLVFRARSCHATSQNPQDSRIGIYVIHKGSSCRYDLFSQKPASSPTEMIAKAFDEAWAELQGGPAMCL
jgi:hypothetical protein